MKPKYCGNCALGPRTQQEPCVSCFADPARPAHVDWSRRPEVRCDLGMCGRPECIDCYPVAQPVPAPAAERYPDDNPKTRFGLAKPPIALIPGPALVIAAEAMRDGATKYGPANWRTKPVTTSTYTSAALRHLLAWIDGEENAPDSGVHHLGHVIGCVAILIDAQAQGTLNDDRPTPGKTAELLAEKTRPMA